MAKICLDLGTSIEQIETLNLVSGGELTISSGAVTVTKSLHTIDTEADAVTDDLDTINGGSAGDIILLSRANAGRAVVLKHNDGNIKTPSGTDHELTALGFVILKHDGSNWHVQSGNGSGYVLNKQHCLAVATSNVTLAGEQTIDGVACAAESRVFLAGQTDEIENGPWIVKAGYYYGSGNWVRPEDFQDGFSVSGHLFYIEAGTANAETVWLIANHYGDDIVGTDDLIPVNLTGGSGGGGSEFDISALTAESSNSDSDHIAIYDASASAMRKQTRSEFLAGVGGGIDFDSLADSTSQNNSDDIIIYDQSAAAVRKQNRSQFLVPVAASYVSKTTTITAGIGLTGGGDLFASRTLNLDVNDMSESVTADDTDSIAIFDESAGGMRKQTRSNFLSGVGDVSESRQIIAGVGLTGGGDLSADRTISLDYIGLTAESSPASGDLIAIYDVSASAYRKQTRSEFLAGVTSGFVPTSRTVTAGNGLSGGGNLSGDISISLDIWGLNSQVGDEDPIGHFATYSGGTTKLITVARMRNKLYPQILDENDGFSVLRVLEQSSNPTSPIAGQAVIWMSDGTGSGDAGDIMISINDGSTTKTITLVDFSAF